MQKIEVHIYSLLQKGFQPIVCRITNHNHVQNMPGHIKVYVSFELFGVKSLYRSSAGRHFYGTENVILAVFGLIGNTYWKKKFGPIMSNFWGRLYHVFGWKKKSLIFFWKCCSVRTEKLHSFNLRIFFPPKHEKTALK